MTSPASVPFGLAPPQIITSTLTTLDNNADTPMLACHFLAEGTQVTPSPYHPAGSALRDKPVERSQVSRVDLLSPEEVQRRLAMTEAALRLLVNSGALAAYNLAGHIRFRAGDIALLEAQLAQR